MAKIKRPAVAILFLGGTTLDERGRVGATVVKPADIKPWLAQMSEMDIIADTEGCFITSGLNAVTLSDWAKAAETIKEKYNAVDGFVIIHRVDSIPAAAATLGLMLQNLEKPVVIVGSPIVSPTERAAGLSSSHSSELRQFGAKANFINAVQVAVSDVAEVVVIVGSHIYRGQTLDFTGSPETTKLAGLVIGKIDFGIRFFGKQIQRASRAFRIRPKFDPKVAVAEYVPGLDLHHLTAMAKGAHGLFLSIPPGGGFSVQTIRIMTGHLGRSFPIAVFGGDSRSGPWPENVIIMTGQTRTAALMRMMWALGQATELAKRKKLLNTNRATGA